MQVIVRAVLMSHLNGAPKSCNGREKKISRKNPNE